MSKQEMTMVTGRVPKELLGALKDELYGKGNHISTADSERAQVLAESFQHFARSCHGSSCRQGRLPCRESCPPAAEMACVGPEDEPQTRWQRFRQWFYETTGI